MRVTIRSIMLALMILVGPALCERLREGDGEVARWFGVSATDMAAAHRFAGRPLRVKARFVREPTDGEGVAAQQGMTSGRARSFLVVAEGGEIWCEMSAQATCGAVANEMKRGTPVVIHGTLDARRNVFLADTIVQGWGRDQMEDGS